MDDMKRERDDGAARHVSQTSARRRSFEKYTRYARFLPSFLFGCSLAWMVASAGDEESVQKEARNTPLSRSEMVRVARSLWQSVPQGSVLEEALVFCGDRLPLPPTHRFSCAHDGAGDDT
ncbi:hypothetical protein MRX96_004859 [Rhipicephalus microplus]